MERNVERLSANDLLSLDCSFLTAQENHSSLPNRLNQIVSLGTTCMFESDSDDYHEIPDIRSQALVDSDNEESTDNEELEVERAAKTSSCGCGATWRVGRGAHSGDFSVSDLRKVALDNEPQMLTKSLEAGVAGLSKATGGSIDDDGNGNSRHNSQRTVGRDKMAWQRRSLLYRSCAVQENDNNGGRGMAKPCDDDDDDDDESIGADHSIDINRGIANASSAFKREHLYVSESKYNSEFVDNDANHSERTCGYFSHNKNDSNTDAAAAANDDDGEEGKAKEADSCNGFEKLPQRPGLFDGNITNEAILIRIEDCFSLPNSLPVCEPTATSLINPAAFGQQQHYLPPPPPPSPTSDSALDSRQFGNSVGATYVVGMDGRLSQGCVVGANGSLSDNSHQHSANKEAILERRQMQERLRNWKKSNKIITHIRENPFNMHMDCLERLSRGTGNIATDSFTPRIGENVGKSNATISTKGEGEPEEEEEGTEGQKHEQEHQHQRQHEQSLPNKHLHTYATHLSHLYKKNQTLMDNNNDFRTLLYNIICCLLIQDEQTLSTPSVTKMIDVIRTHLESASKFYSVAMLAVTSTGNPQSQLLGQLNNNNDNNQQLQQQHQHLLQNDNLRKSSLGSVTSCASSSSSIGFNVTSGPKAMQLQSSRTNSPTSSKAGDDTIGSNNQLHPESAMSRQKKPVDFRRISSVSYNDEQLINDLCDTNQPSGSSTNGKSAAHCPDSPWKYEELSSECKHHSNNHRTSQSSLENNSSINLDFMNDSGIGTIYDYQADDGPMSRDRNRSKRYSDVGEQFSKMTKPSYLSTDDYLSHFPEENSVRTLLYDDESSVLQRNNSSDPRPVDVASRRAELEWTLNKLINFELKYTWLTSQDTLRRAIRKIGVPNEIRGKVWLILIEQMIGTKYDAAKLLDEAGKTIEEEEELNSLRDDETQSILKQIDLDVNRTMPGHKLFDDGAEGGIKLRRILVAYSIHVNRAIAYCQGFNFIVALLLSVFEGDEEKALRGFICIVDHIFPSKFYFDHYLTGARADQFLLADFICDQLIKNPTTAERKMVEGVTSSITLNWFISLFHGAVPTLTRLTILDHFMLEGVKALFRFTMAILYLAFQVTSPSSCDVMTTIRTTAKDMYDIKLLLSIVEQIKLPKDSYFAIRRSFYMVQSSFNSDQFYMQSLSNDASRQLVSNKPLSVQQMPDTKPPAMSLMTAASFVAHQSFGISSGDHHHYLNTGGHSADGLGRRVCTSSDRSKVCIQKIGKLGRSHIKIMDANVRSNERSLISPLRNCLVIGISNCGKNIIVARQSSRRNFKTFRDQDLMFHVHELCTEIFDGFYLEDHHLALILTHMGEIYKIDVAKCFADSLVKSTETLLLRDSHSISETEKAKLRIASIDVLTNLLWIYVECEDITTNSILANSPKIPSTAKRLSETLDSSQTEMKDIRPKCRSSNPFLWDLEDTIPAGIENQGRANYQRKILVIDIITFDIFSAFTVHQSFGDITNMRTCIVAFCQLANPLSNQFSSRIVRIGPTGPYEHLLSFSDVVDFMVNAPESCKREQEDSSEGKKAVTSKQRYSSIKKLLARSTSLNDDGNLDDGNDISSYAGNKSIASSAGTLTKYYRSLMKSHSTTVFEECHATGRDNHQVTQNNESSSEQLKEAGKQISNNSIRIPSGGPNRDHSPLPRVLIEHPCRDIINSCLDDIEDAIETNYIPVNMAFIFKNGKIALFEFTESYAIHTRESQLERYDYSKVIEVTKNGEDFILTILTVQEKLIKVVI